MKNLNEIYNRVGLLAEVILDQMDELQNTNRYNKKLKYHGNRFVNELEKTYKEYYQIFEDKQEIDETYHDMRDIRDLSQKAYFEALEFFKNRPANEIIAIMNRVKQAEAAGWDLKKEDIPYKPSEK